MSDWQGKDVETPLQVALAGVEELVRSAHIQTDADVAAKRFNVANVIAWNGAADVADCWPGEDLPRTPDQLAAALDLASRCVSWRQQLGKGPHARAMAHWLHGYLLLRNDRAEEALDAMEASELLYREATQAADKALAACDFPVVLAHGYVGIAHAALGRDQAAYDSALTIFRSQESAGSENGAFGRKQLERARGKVLG